ncbi:hypothetical protein HPB50_000548 [Hyalomma asiaticum]|uniref:Uncharacterized protein n=1 Tax=Hyalomma asiaticum TaxID=266040 RepID=A0ACB7T2I8_HYAAI|nr:hypothetical protein HPB50_000548 [Hyalomma asiaticum]
MKRKGEPPEVTTTTSSYETALTTISRKESCKERDGARGSLPSTTLAPVSETVPEWLESPEAGFNQSRAEAGVASTDCSPVDKVPSDQWLPRNLSQLGIPYVPRTGPNASAIPVQKTSETEHSAKSSKEPFKISEKHSEKSSQGSSIEPSTVCSKETVKKPYEGRTEENRKQSPREHFKAPRMEHSEKPALEYSWSMSKDLPGGPRKNISKEPSKQTAERYFNELLEGLSKKHLEDASNKSSQQVLKEVCEEPSDGPFKRPSMGPSKAAPTGFPAKHPESFRRLATELAGERIAVLTETLTGDSESSGTKVRYPSSKEAAGHSERSNSTSMIKDHAEKRIAPNKIAGRHISHSLTTKRPLRETEAARTTNLLSGATSPFAEDSSVSSGKRTIEDTATEPKEEHKVESKVQPVDESTAESTIDLGCKPNILAQPSFERMVLASSLPQQSPPGRRAQQHPTKRGRKDRTRAKRQVSLSKSLFAPVLAVLLVVAIAVLITAILEHWWNRDRPTVKGLFGAVRGERIVFSDQGHEWTVHAFLGVPFAKVPRGSLRFKPPQQLDSPLGKGPGGTALDSVAKRPPCPQQDFFLGQELVSTANGSEDCLHVNIWAPARNCSSDTEYGSCQGKTVLFFLYGASFQNGGNSFELYDGRYLSALGDLVVVVPNYRVGAMGFLMRAVCKHRLALSWTLTNIELFGGNASRLVLAGHDAGATSLGYHLFSGDSSFWTRSVARFILQSGGPFHRYEGNGVDGAVRLATSLQCPADLVTEASLRCLQNASADAVARNKMAPSFAPVLKRPPLSRPRIRQALEMPAPNAGGPQGKQFLLGRVQNEGAYPWFVEQQRTGLSDPQRLAARLIGNDNLDRWQNASGVVLDPTADDESYQEAVGDVLEACPMSLLAEQLHASKNRVYAYVLGYRPVYSSWRAETEATHFNDMELVFGMPLRPGSPSTQLDKQWSRTMIRVWSTFAHTGKPPTLKNSKWPAYDSFQLTTMKLGPKGVTGQRDPKWQRCRALRDSGAGP